MILKLLLSLVIIYSLKVIWQAPFPTLPYLQLTHFMDEWSLVDRHQKKQFFDYHRIILDAGFFILLELTGDSPRKVLVIFFDQLTHAEHRQLRLMERLQRKKK